MVEYNYHSENEVENNGRSHNKLTVAPVSDRLLAFAIDALLFTPFCSLLLAPLIKRFQILRLHDPDSTELLVFLAVITASYVAVIVFVQFFFLMISQGTPGKVFLKLKVISVSDPAGRLTWTQAFLRSFFWVLDGLALMLPFLEILSQKQRRPLHDRVAETMVVTLKKINSDTPHKFEANFIRQILIVSFTVFIFWGFNFLSQIHKQALNGNFKKEELLKTDYLCSEINSKTDGSRLDQALALYLAGEISEDCLSSEVDVVIWAPQAADRDWAFLAKAYLNKFDKDKYSEYLQIACPQDGYSLVCDIVHKNPKPPRSMTAAVLKIEEYIQAGRYLDLQNILQNFPARESFSKYLSTIKIKTAWMSGEKEKAQGGFDIVDLDNQQTGGLNSWLCIQEVKDSCDSGQSFKSCQNLKRDLAYGEELSEQAIYAILLEKECLKSSEPSLQRFKDYLYDNKPLAQLIEAISADLKLNSEQRLEKLTSLSKDPSASLFLQNEALYQLIRKSKSDIEIKRALDLAKSKDISKYEFDTILKTAKHSAQNLNSSKLLAYIQELKSGAITSSARTPASTKEK